MCIMQTTSSPGEDLGLFYTAGDAIRILLFHVTFISDTTIIINYVISYPRKIKFNAADGCSGGAQPLAPPLYPPLALVSTL